MHYNPFMVIWGMVYDIVSPTVWKIFLFLDDLPTYHGDFPWREKITTRQQLCTWRVTSGVTTIGLWLSPLDWPKKKTWALPSYTPNRPCWGCCKESADSAGDLAVVSSGKMAKLGANHKGYGGFLKYGYPQIIHFRSF